jgi:hypothetical protein
VPKEERKLILLTLPIAPWILETVVPRLLELASAPWQPEQFAV